MKTPFLGQAYSLRSLPLSAQTLVNLYAERNESDEGEAGAFLGTPGLTLRTTTVSGEGRGLWPSNANSQEILYAVVGNSVYTIDLAWRATLLGTLPNTSGRVSLTNNSTQTVIAHSSGWHLTTGPGTGLTAVSGSPSNSLITYMDGYVIFTDGDGKFGVTAINDASSISGLDVAEAEALPDGLVCPFADQREVWLVGEQTTEIWSDTGALSFPWERIPGGVISIGCTAKFSVAYLDGSLFWLTRDRTGNATVVRTLGYQLAPVSTHALEHAISGYAVISDAWGYGYQSEGHTFYVLNFPTADVTWSYDCATKLWHRRAYRDTQGVLHASRPNAYAFFNGQHVALDPSNGNIYTMDLDTYTDNGTPIYRERAWMLMAPQEMHRMRCDYLELVAETGVGTGTGNSGGGFQQDFQPDFQQGVLTNDNPQVWLQMSFDGGVSFGNSHYQNLGPIGSRNWRARWRRNGVGRRPVAKVATTMQNKVGWLAVNVDGEVLGQ